MGAVLDHLIRPVTIEAESGWLFLVHLLALLGQEDVVDTVVRLELVHLNACEAGHSRMSHDIGPFLLLYHLVLLVTDHTIQENVHNLVGNLHRI